MREQCTAIFRQARRDVIEAGMPELAGTGEAVEAVEAAEEGEAEASEAGDGGEAGAGPGGGAEAGRRQAGGRRRRTLRRSTDSEHTAGIYLFIYTFLHTNTKLSKIK